MLQTSMPRWPHRWSSCTCSTSSCSSSRRSRSSSTKSSNTSSSSSCSRSSRLSSNRLRWCSNSTHINSSNSPSLNRSSSSNLLTGTRRWTSSSRTSSSCSNRTRSSCSSSNRRRPRLLPTMGGRRRNPQVCPPSTLPPVCLRRRSAWMPPGQLLRWVQLPRRRRAGAHPSCGALRLHGAPEQCRPPQQITAVAACRWAARRCSSLGSCPTCRCSWRVLSPMAPTTVFPVCPPWDRSRWGTWARITSRSPTGHHSHSQTGRAACQHRAPMRGVIPPHRSRSPC
mmetsp:Transcript_2247/g.6676  ORF Transcript_2247/g.6676 Transcript_2247/m.6676 type:complete len:282 (-) Transcript_2247:710-1555(-)